MQPFEHLSRIIIGDYSGGHFHPHRSVGIDTLLMENTPFGWRIQNPVWNWTSIRRLPNHPALTSYAH